MSTPGTSVVIVLHNSAETLEDCLASLPEDTEAIVVDNASTDGGPDIVRRLRPEATVDCQPNRGFGAGCNRGACLARGEVVVFLNPDAQLEGDALAHLTERAARGPRSVFGPLLCDATGVVRANVRRRSRPLHEVAELLPSAALWLPSAWRRDLPPGDRSYAQSGPVDYLQGACLAMARHEFLALGGFDERFFLYSEEEDLCDRVRAAGGECVLVPSARVRHLGQTSARKVGRFSTRQMYRSKTILYRRRLGRGRGALAVGAIAAALVLHLPLAVLQLVRRTGGKDPGWVRAAFGGLVDGSRAPLAPLLCPPVDGAASELSA